MSAPRMPLQCTPASRCAELRTEARISGQPPEPRCERLDVVGLDQPTRPAVLEHFAEDAVYGN